MRKFKYNNFNGLFFSTIPFNKVNADLNGVMGGDYFKNSKGDFLRHTPEGFKIVINDGSNYFSNEDLKEVFINFRLEVNNNLVK